MAQLEMAAYSMIYAMLCQCPSPPQERTSFLMNVYRRLSMDLFLPHLVLQVQPKGAVFFFFHTMQNLQIDRARVHQSMGHIEKKNETHVYVQRLLTQALLLFKQIDI